MDHIRDELLRKQLWNEEDNKVYEQVRAVMLDALDQHQSKPSLLHGDLWGGNYMFYQMVVQLYLIQHHCTVIVNLI